MMAPFGAAMISAIMVNSLADLLPLLLHYFIFMVAVTIVALTLLDVVVAGNGQQSVLVRLVVLVGFGAVLMIWTNLM